ncbi:uncharacterized protein PAC_06662 [Phialocephala subalpina]|uniref:Enoyl reductase (ER) domain-containing protein n=1 Tax=Phialocephala subalpina TaxID=576137 RepID=A0A1L7WVK0_9HELO|nr:uncharacterized protein PAC_06662 [Phialocephala subalpina]
MEPLRAVVPSPGADLRVEKYEPMAPQDGQVQVQLKATSLNPLDWKRIEKNLFIPSYPHVLGMDISGVVVNQGASTKFKNGERIMGIGTVGWSDGGSYQTHILIDEKNACKIPDNISFAEAATIPFAFATAACAIHLELGFPYSSANRAASPPVLIWGASGSVGNFAVQLAKLHGSQVIAVSSTRSLASAETIGADLVLDSSDPDVVSKIRSAAPNIEHVFDTIVSEASVANCTAAFGNHAGTLATAIKNTHENKSKGVQIKPVYSGNIQGKNMGPGAHEQGARLGEFAWDNLTQWLKDGDITPLKYETIRGLQSVNEGLGRLKNGEYKSKLVVEV